MLPDLFTTVDQVPTPVPNTVKIFDEESPGQRNEVIFLKSLNKYICYLLWHNKLLQNDYKLPLRAENNRHMLSHIICESEMQVQSKCQPGLQLIWRLSGGKTLSQALLLAF